MKDKDKAKIIHFAYKVKEKKESFNYDINGLEQVSNYISDGFHNLKKNDTIKTRSEIEYNIYKYSSYPGFLWQSRLIAIYHIYATIIGVLDARYDSYNRDLAFENGFYFKNEENINLCKKNIDIIKDTRNKIIEDYYEIIPSDELDIIKNIITEIPLHKEFDKLCNDMKTHYHSGSLQGEFMTSYLLGYNKSLYFDETEVINLYYDLLVDYKEEYLKKEYHRNLVKKLILDKHNN